MNMIMRILSPLAMWWDRLPYLHQVYLDLRLAFGYAVMNYELIYDTKVSRIWIHPSHAENPQSMRWNVSHPQSSGSPSSVSAAEEALLIPADWIQAARWSTCASAPPSCPYSSDSLSSAVESLPVNDTLRTRPLTSTDTRKKNIVSLTIKWMLNKTYKNVLWCEMLCVSFYVATELWEGGLSVSSLPQAKRYSTSSRHNIWHSQQNARHHSDKYLFGPWMCKFHSHH